MRGQKVYNPRNKKNFTKENKTHINKFDPKFKFISFKKYFLKVFFSLDGEQNGTCVRHLNGDKNVKLLQRCSIDSFIMSVNK